MARSLEGKLLSGMYIHFAWDLGSFSTAFWKMIVETAVLGKEHNTGVFLILMMAMASFLYCLLVRFWSAGANLPRTYQCGWSMLPHGEAKYWTRRRLSTNLPDEPEEGQRWSHWSLSPSFWCKSGLTSLLVVADTVLRTRQLDKQSRAYRIS